MCQLVFNQMATTLSKIIYIWNISELVVLLFNRIQVQINKKNRIFTPISI